MKAIINAIRRNRENRNNGITVLTERQYLKLVSGKQLKEIII